MNAVEFLKNVRSGQPEPLYLLMGEERYLQRECLNALVQAIVPDESVRVFSFSEHDVAAESLDAVLCAANQFPMLTARRLVVARNFDKIADQELDALKNYLRSPNPTTTLVFQAETLDKRRNSSAALLKGCTPVECNRLSENDLTQWGQQFARRQGYEFAPQALGKLVGLTGTDLMILAGEIQKLMCYTGAGGSITLEAVDALAVRSRQYDNFTLSDAVLSGNGATALRALHRLLDQGEEPVALVGLLAWSFRQMLTAHEMMTANAPREEIARELRMPPSRLTNFLGTVRKKSEKDIRHAIRRLNEIDLAIKSSRATPRLQLEFFLCEIAAK